MTSRRSSTPAPTTARPSCSRRPCRPGSTGSPSATSRDPVRIEIAGDGSGSAGSPLVRQTAYVVPRSHKAAALGRILDVESPTASIVFCRTRHEVDQLTETLNGRGYRAEGLHGGMNQEQRDRVMGRMRSGTADLLIATDVAARGLDLDQLTHVVNYDVPSAPEAYVHRIGRVGRAGREGVAITLAEPREHRLFKNIERITGQKLTVEKIPTVADLRNRRMELTLATLRETIVADDFDRYAVIVETLSDDFDVIDVATAAVKLAHEVGVGSDADAEEIPDVSAPKDRSPRPQRGRDSAPPQQGRTTSEGRTRLYVSTGRNNGVRPGDLVGAICGETKLGGRDIGAIEIADRFSLVEVPDDAVDEVIAALKRTSIRGRKANARRERF